MAGPVSPLSYWQAGAECWRLSTCPDTESGDPDPKRLRFKELSHCCELATRCFRLSTSRSESRTTESPSRGLCWGKVQKGGHWGAPGQVFCKPPLYMTMWRRRGEGSGRGWSRHWGRHVDARQHGARAHATSACEQRPYGRCRSSTPSARNQHAARARQGRPERRGAPAGRSLRRTRCPPGRTESGPRGSPDQGHSSGWRTGRGARRRARTWSMKAWRRVVWLVPWRQS